MSEPFSKGNLAGTYTWTTSPGDNPAIVGLPDSRRFSHKEGYEVLDAINKVAKALGLTKLDHCRALEQQIRSKDLASETGRATLVTKLTTWARANLK